MKTLLTTIVGSKAHGTDTPESDTDTRSIYALPTSSIVGIGNYQKFISNDETDNNSWELSHFIYLTLRCNPSTLEVLLADPIIETEWGKELRSLFPCFLCRNHVYNAFRGFAEQQRRKMISPTTNQYRKPKAAAHYLRILYNGIELLNTGSMTIRIADTPIGYSVIIAKKGQALFEDVLYIGDRLLLEIDEAYKNSTMQLEPDKERINKFLLSVRRAYWE